MRITPQCPRCLRYHPLWELCSDDCVKLAKEAARRQRVKQHAQPELTYQEHQQAIAKRKGNTDETAYRG